MTPTQNPNESGTPGTANPNPPTSSPNSSEPTISGTPSTINVPNVAASPTTPTPAATPLITNENAAANTTETPAASNPDSIVSAPRKSRASTIIAALVLLLALGGAGAAYFLLSQGQPKANTNSSQIAADLSASNPSNETLNPLRLKDNSLSDFDLAFLRLQNEQKTEQTSNIIYSPLSIKYALAMLSDAAEGESKTEIANLIGDYRPNAYLDSANRSFANALFVNSNYRNAIKPAYTELVQSKYYAEAREDAFAGPETINAWVGNKTLGLIPQLLGPNDVDATNTIAVLVNALGIDMEWQRIFDECAEAEASDNCISFSSHFAHEKYAHSLTKSLNPDIYPYPEITFNGQAPVKGVQAAATANRYDLVQTLGEETVRSTVQKAYDEWLVKTKTEAAKAEANPNSGQFLVDYAFDLDAYINELKQNYGAYQDSTDFSYYLSDYEQVFAKDLKEYDGATLQYVAIMPLPGDNNTTNSAQALTDYVKNLQTPKLNSLISSLKPAEVNSFKDGVVTTLDVYLPLFSFDYNYESFNDDLKTLGVSKVFDSKQANLSGIFDLSVLSDNPFVTQAIHAANIDFSNKGIKAAAATATVLGRGGGGTIKFDYEWDVPVETITLNFDSPFLFLIRDKATGEIWFTGEVFQP